MSAALAFRVLCMRIVALGGQTVRLVEYPIDMRMSNGTLYLSLSGHQFTGVSTGGGFEPDTIDIEGIMAAGGITRRQLASGAWDGARCFVFATDWRAPVEDDEPIMVGLLGRVTLRDERYRAEAVSLAGALGRASGRVYTAGCQKRFGGVEYAGCGVSLAAHTVTGTVTGVTSRTVMRDGARSEPAGHFVPGELRFTSGANAGLPAIAIASYAANGTITLVEGWADPVLPGDQYSMLRQCPKTLQACIDRGNVLNFGGFPNVPDSQAYNAIGQPPA